jgi:hypothetical protein
MIKSTGSLFSLLVPIFFCFGGLFSPLLSLLILFTIFLAFHDLTHFYYHHQLQRCNTLSFNQLSSPHPPPLFFLFLLYLLRIVFASPSLLSMYPITSRLVLAYFFLTFDCRMEFPTPTQPIPLFFLYLVSLLNRTILHRIRNSNESFELSQVQVYVYFFKT